MDRKEIHVNENSKQVGRAYGSFGRRRGAERARRAGQHPEWVLTPKTLITEQGEVRIETPRDRNGTFEPRIVRKRQRRFEGFDDKILALYSRGLSTRDIEAHLAELYGVSVGRDLISRSPTRSWTTSANGSSGRLRTSTRS